jgi:hypothetical protein
MPADVPFPFITRDEFALQGDPAVLEILYASTSSEPAEVRTAV